MALNLVPPGFASQTAFTLKRVEKVEESNGCNGSVDATEQEQNRMETTSDVTDLDKLKRSLKHRPWILFDQSDQNSEEPDSEVQFDADPPVRRRWNPEDVRREVLEEAPVFYPTEEEFKDTFKYVASIRARAEKYGLCRIVPPPSWEPPCLVKKKHIWKSSTFSSHVQRIDGLRDQYSPCKVVESPKKKRRKTIRGSLDCGSTSTPGENGHSYVKGFEPEHGREFTLENFKTYAADFKRQYFHKSEVTGTPSLKNIEAEYKRITENPTEVIEVLCGDNMETKALGSGFPTVSNDSNHLETSDYPEYVASGWNLNNLPRQPGSLLSFESHDTCHILVPRAHVGMCFSSFHWKVEEHHLYSLSYIHLGDPKLWYGVPAKYNANFEVAMRNSSSDSSELRHRLVKQLSPSTLKSQGIPVFRVTQSPGQFVLVFPGAYHSGFDSGFNFSETACFAPLDWLPHGQNAVELYSEQGRNTSLSHDKLLLGAAGAAVKAQWDSLFRKSDNLFWKDACGEDGILTRVFKSRLKSEGISRKYLSNSSQSRRMDSDFDSTTKRECSICLCDLHFSAAGCPCSPDRYSCLLHAKQLCSCAWSDKLFLYRYKNTDLDLLLEALEGKFDSVLKWGKNHLGLTLHMHLPKNSEKSPGHVDGSASDAADKIIQKASISQNAIRAQLKAHILQSTISNKSKANDHPMESLDAATSTGNGFSSVSSIMSKVKAHVPQSTIVNEQKTKENTVGPATITTNASHIPIEGTFDVSSVSETSSSDSEDITPDLISLLRRTEQINRPLLAKRKVPERRSKGGNLPDRRASPRLIASKMGDRRASPRLVASKNPDRRVSPRLIEPKNQVSRQPCSQTEILLLSDDSDG